MPSKTLKSDKPKVVRKSRKTAVKAASEPVITLTESHHEIKDEGGMISSGGVEIIGLLGLVALIYATGLLYLFY